MNFLIHVLYQREFGSRVFVPQKKLLRDEQSLLDPDPRLGKSRLDIDRIG